jgi:hypothetical protein
VILADVQVIYMYIIMTDKSGSPEDDPVRSLLFKRG